MTESTNAGLIIEGLGVTYGTQPALEDASVYVREGTVTAVLGPSGSGKSSLLRAVAGLETPVTGRVIVDGTDVTASPPHARGFGMMFQSGALFPHLSVADNVGYGLVYGRARMPRAARRERVAHLLDLVGLSDLASRSPETLSGGQAQRVALARALAPSPRVLLLDEPLSALDRSLRERLAVELRAIMTGAGVAGLYVTHDQDEAFTVADRLAILIDGRVRREGTTREVWQCPHTAEVATFLGYGPLVACEVARSWGVEAPDPGRVLALAPGALTLGEDAPAGGVSVPARVRGVRDVRGARTVKIALAGVGEASALAPVDWDSAEDTVRVCLDVAKTAWVTPS